MQRQASNEGGDDEAEHEVPESFQMPDGRHWSEREWPGLDVGNLRPVLDKHSLEVDSEADWVSELVEQTSMQPSSFVTTAHRQVHNLQHLHHPPAP